MRSKSGIEIGTGNPCKTASYGVLEGSGPCSGGEVGKCSRVVDIDGNIEIIKKN
jgi:hypothetical protein